MGEHQLLQGRIHHPAGEGVLYGPGSRIEVAALVSRLGATRPFRVTTPSVVRSGLPEQLAPLDPVGMFDGSREHTPAPVVLDGAKAARAADADCLISLGGSSVIDLTKGIAMVLAEGDNLESLRMRHEPGGTTHRPRLEGPKLPHIAVPTTLSGAEFTGAAGITQPEVGEKQLYADPKLTPRWVVFDPELARHTPSALWAGTGMKLLADCLEVTCSRRGTPLSEACALGALKLLVEDLPPAVADPNDLTALSRCQFAVAMALPQLAAVGVGLVAAFRHQLGGALGVPHGIASTIMLPHVLRWNLPTAAEPLGRAAAALGLSDPDALVDRLENLTDELGLPGRLRDVNVARSDLPAVANHALHDPASTSNIRRADSVGQLEELLIAAW
jgi:alcohol dehydrogenase class IV